MSEREELRAILKERSILKGDFTLASGRKSDYYINGKMTTLYSRGLYLAARLILDRLQDCVYDGFAGPTIGADPLIGALLTLSAQKGEEKEGLLIRKEAKDHGTKNLLEGRCVKGMKIVLLEDVATTGGSLLRSAKALEAEQARIARIMAVVDRAEGARENLTSSGYEYEFLFDVEELL